MFASLFSKTKKKSSPPARNRQLGFDSLEVREVLTGFELPLDPPPADPPSGPGEELPPVIGSGEGGSGSEGDPGDPPPGDGSGDLGFGGFGTTTFDPSGGGSGGGGGGTQNQNQAPILLSLDWSVSGNIYSFYGYVSDDADPTGLYVYFGGIISGAYTEVLNGGYFCLEIQLDNPEGTVTAIFADAEWLWSNEGTTMVG